MIKGYKVFEPNWTCRGFQYKVGEIFTEDVTPSVCSRGFHFCEKAADCFNYYKFDSKNKVAEVVALGDIDRGEDKLCTNKIQIVREIPWTEMLEIVNTGKGCTGYCNSGNCNSGDYNGGNHNSGDGNSGNWNSGIHNSGNCNSGNYNSGNGNSGNYNSGYYNSGNHNGGNYNSGNWNKCNFSNGCFNTIEPKIHLFNKPSEWTYRDWLNSAACSILNHMPQDILEYILWENMSDEEKKAHPEAETTGGYLRKLDSSKYATTWWKELPDNEKAIITSLPNFDKKVFKEIMGIDIDK